MITSSKSILNYQYLSEFWDNNARKAPKDCLEANFHISRKLADELNILPNLKPIKKFKKDELIVYGREHVEAKNRYPGRKDRLGNQLIVFIKDGRPHPGSPYTLKEGMLVYTSEYSEWYSRTKQIARWSKRHMRMYIGNGTFRDNKNWGGTRSGDPVWGGRRMHYVVLSVYDPFSAAR